MDPVLIETYWNVKKSRRKVRTVQPSINRNILECKVKNELINLGMKNVLIETYWNVKTIAVMIHAAGFAVLIETYWNVKG